MPGHHAQAAERPLLPDGASARGDPAAAPYRPPIDAGRLPGFFAARAIPGVEELQDQTYRRPVVLPNGPGVLSLRHAPADGGTKHPSRAAGQAKTGAGTRPALNATWD
jgi:hypothetical protein